MPNFVFFNGSDNAQISPKKCLVIFLLVSSRQKSLFFYFLHFLCIFSEDDATFGKNRAFCAKCLWSRSLLRKKEDLGHRFRWHKAFKITIWLDSSNCKRIKEIAPKRINHFCWNKKAYSHSKVLRIIPIKQYLRGALNCIFAAEISLFSVVNWKSVVRSVVNDCLCFLHRVGELEESDTVH